MGTRARGIVDDRSDVLVAVSCGVVPLRGPQGSGAPLGIKARTSIGTEGGGGMMQLFVPTATCWRKTYFCRPPATTSFFFLLSSFSFFFFFGNQVESFMDDSRGPDLEVWDSALSSPPVAIPKLNHSD